MPRKLLALLVVLGGAYSTSHAQQYGEATNFDRNVQPVGCDRGCDSGYDNSPCCCTGAGGGSIFAGLLGGGGSAWEVRGGWLYLERTGGNGSIFSTGDRDGDGVDDDDTDTDLFDNDDDIDLTDADDGDNDNDDLNDVGFDNGTIGNRLLGGDDFDLGYASGWEVSMLRLPTAMGGGALGCGSACGCGQPVGCGDCCCGAAGAGAGCGMELRYFQLEGWDDTRTLVLDDDDTLGGINPIQIGRDATAAVRYDSDLYNAEINLLRAAIRPGVYLIGGFRYVRLEETLGARLTDVGDTDVASFGYDLENDLYGGQLGALIDLGQRGPLTVRAFGKAGIYGVDSDSDFGLDSDIDIASRSSDSGVAFVGELGLTGGYALTNNLSIESGYRLLWIDGVALATEQVDSTNFQNGAYNLNNDGDVFYHGVTASAVYRW